MLTLNQLEIYDIVNFLIVIVFWLAPTVYGIITFIYFIIKHIKRKDKFRYQNKQKTNGIKLPIVLLTFNFVNFTWAWMSSFLFIMLLWGTPVNETFVWTGLAVQVFFCYIAPFINLFLFLKSNKIELKKAIKPSWWSTSFFYIKNFTINCADWFLRNNIKGDIKHVTT